MTKIVTENVERESYLHTDESRLYGDADQLFAEHHTVKHSVGEYVCGTVHTNTVEGLFSVFKRGMTGVYQHCGEKHLHRYLAEFDFRYNHRVALGVNDAERADQALVGSLASGSPIERLVEGPSWYGRKAEAKAEADQSGR